MKVNILVCIISVILTINISSQQNLNVVDYYNLIPVKYFGTFKYLLENKDGKWISHTAKKEVIYPTVDMNNYYIYIEEFLGQQRMVEKINRITVAIFLREKGKNPVIAVQFHDDSTPNDNDYLDFLEVSNKICLNVTSSIFPKINYEVFFKKDFDPEKYFSNEIAYSGLTKLIYILPREGTAIKCSIFVDDRILDENSSERYHNNKIYDTLEINWNYKSGIFEIGKIY